MQSGSEFGKYLHDLTQASRRQHKKELSELVLASFEELKLTVDDGRKLVEATTYGQSHYDFIIELPEHLQLLGYRRQVAIEVVQMYLALSEQPPRYKWDMQNYYKGIRICIESAAIPDEDTVRIRLYWDYDVL